MRHKTDCFLTKGNGECTDRLVTAMQANNTVNNIHIMENGMHSTDAIRQMAETAEADYVLMYTKPTPLTMGQGMLDRLLLSLIHI